jgi:hypothetical protein
MIQFKIYKDNYGLHGRFSLGSWNFQTKLFKNYNLAHTIGVRNNVGAFRLIFIDWDCSVLDFVIDEVKYLQERFCLSDFYIFQSSQKSDGFHGICLDKLLYREFVEAMEYTSSDEYYKSMPQKNDANAWVLRALSKAGSQKPVLIRIVKSKHNLRQKSLAHYLYLLYNYGIKRKSLKNLDNNTKLYLVKYGTLNYIDVAKKEIRNAHRILQKKKN